MRLTAHIHLAARLRMNGAVTSFSTYAYAFRAFVEKTLPCLPRLFATCFLYRSAFWLHKSCFQSYYHLNLNISVGLSVPLLRGGADKSLARPESKQATATKLGIYSTHSPRSSIHFLALCSKFCKPLKKQKKTEVCPSNQVSEAAMTSALDEKWRTFNCLFSTGNRW